MANMMQNMGQSGASTGTGGLGATLGVAGTFLSAMGQMQSGASQVELGQHAQQLAQFQAAQLRQNAGTDVAAAQRSAVDIQRQSDYVASHALAVAASSGGGASDPTVINLIARTAGETAYRKSVALYQGDQAARGANMQADATIYGGEMARAKGAQVGAASDIGAATTLVKGGASLFSKYGMGGPATDSEAYSPSYASGQF